VLSWEVNSSLTPRPAFLRNFPAWSLSFTSFPAPLLPRRARGAKLLPVSPFAATLTKTIGGGGSYSFANSLAPKRNPCSRRGSTLSKLGPSSIATRASSIFQFRSAIFSCCLHGSANSNHSHTYKPPKINPILSQIYANRGRVPSITLTCMPSSHLPPLPLLTSSPQLP
jgi:hypothetical protein